MIYCVYLRALCAIPLTYHHHHVVVVVVVVVVVAKVSR